MTGEENVSPGSCLVANNLPCRRSNTLKMPSVHTTNRRPSSHQEVAKIDDCNCNVYLNFGLFSSIVRGISRQYRFLLWLANMSHSSFIDSVHITGYENTLPYIVYRHICNNKSRRNTSSNKKKEHRSTFYLTIGFDIETTQCSSYRTK